MSNKGLIGFHVQDPPTGGKTAVGKLPPGSPVLAVDNVQYLAECKTVNADVFTVLRHHADELQTFPEMSYEEYQDKARAFLATFIDGTFKQHAAAVDAIKGFNEIWADSQNWEERFYRIRWCKALADVWWNEYRTRSEFKHIRVIIGSAAVGNDMPVELAQIATEFDCIVSYHGYWYTVNGEQPEWEWPTLSGRWEEMDIAWQQAGYKVDWLMTECGPFESAVTGWRSDIVCGGDVECYLRSIQYWMDNAADSDAYREGRLIGGVLFTTFAGGDWPGFDTQMPELERIAELVAAWEPPVPPEPPKTLEETLWDKSVEVQAISLNPEAALQGALFEAGLVPVESETWLEFEGEKYALMAGENLKSGHRAVAWTKVPEWGNVRLLEDPGGA